MDLRLGKSSSRIWHRRIVLVSVLTVSVATTSGFIVRPPQTARAPTLVSVASSALEQMTVKELRQLLKDADLQERGLLSRLKRKQDLVDYLSEHLPQEVEHSVVLDDRINGDEITVNNNVLVNTKRAPKIPLYMPPEEPTSPKEILYEQLYERYPPLRQVDNDSSSDDTVDVRQVHHPMLRNTTASDMDIIFIGTASCTPGTTRGVSCTALRLNWRRRCLPGGTQITGRAPEYSSFTGGTWLFDVGECTQVSSMFV